MVEKSSSAWQSVGRQTLTKYLGSGEESYSNKIYQTSLSVTQGQFDKFFSLIMSKKFEYQPLVAIC